MTRLRCATAAELAGEPLAATAPPADRWLLVEHAGPWGRKAITESRLEPATAAALSRWAGANRARVVLIRRPRAAHRSSPAGRWFRVDARPGRERIRCGTYAGEGELVELLSDPAAGAPSTDPIYLVCTHGRHDPCCALRGRPVADALSTAFPERTWECTHVGGDRYAANVVMLPHGVYYGGVTPRDAVGLAKLHEEGTLDLERLRGRSSLAAPVQAAQHHARLAAEAGAGAAIDAFHPLSCTPSGEDRWTVRLAGPGGAPVTVTVRATLRDAGRPLSCGATGPGRLRVFECATADPHRR